jgi:formaldehyde-activating enzyme
MYIDRKIVEDLCEQSNIIGIKDSSGNLPYLNELINHVGNRISILCGYDEMVYPALMMGADGAILGTANLIPEIWVELYKNVREKRFSMAMKLHHKISRLLRLIRSNGGLIAIKACLEEIGLNVGLSRLPLKIGGSLSLESYEEILLELKRLGIIEDKVARHREIGRNELILRLEELGVPLKQGDISVGYGSKGKGINNVSIALVVGTIGGVLGYKWAEIYSLLKGGYEAVVAVHEPGLMTRPPTLIIPYYKIRNLRQASIIHGVVQSAVADAVTSYTIASLDKAESDKYIILALVAVDPNAIDRDEIYSNTLDAMNMAINMVFGRGG